MAREQYVRPPLMAVEPPSPVVAVWRFRIIAAVLCLIVLVALTWAFISLSGVTGGEDPGIGGALRPLGAVPHAGASAP